MRSILLTLALGLGVLAMGQRNVTIDPAASKVSWTGKKMTGEHTGGIHIKNGTLTWSTQGLMAASVTIDMTTITCSDLEGGAATKLVNHLKSPDFFNVEAHPTATFISTKVQPIDGAAPGRPNYRVTGDLTIKGITHPITFDVLSIFDGQRVIASANLTFDRSKYDVRFGSASFFESIGDKAISDDVQLTFDITAK
ncbi:MAG TPA: YceI family protein [Flavobacteriales bacterium]